MHDESNRDDVPGREPLDPSPEQMRKHGYELIDRLVEHFETLSDQRVARRSTSQELSALVDEPLPQDGCEIEGCFDVFFKQMVPTMTRVNHPRFHAFIPCPSSFAGALGMMLAAGTNPFVGSWLGGASIASLELTVLRWIKEMLDLDPKCEGILTSGGSTANLIGLASARAKFGMNVLQSGRIYVSEEGHASMDKAAAILGFTAQQIRTVPSQDDYRMNLDALQSMVDADKRDGLIPFFVSGNAGTTNTGAIDDLVELAQICERCELWFHVDAAYGGFAAMVPEIRTQMSGLELADSITLDPHKWLYCPMGVGCAFVKDVNYLNAAFSAHGNYLKDLDEDEINFLDRGPELSRPARVLPVWMLIRTAGLKELQHQIREDIRLARMAESLLREDDRFEVEPARLSIVVFRHRLLEGESAVDAAERDDTLMNATLADGELMLSSTTSRGRNCLRLVVMNHRTSETDIHRSVRKIRELAV